MTWLYSGSVRPFGVFIRIGPKVSFAATFGPTEGKGGNGYPILDSPGVQWRVLRRTAVSRRGRPVADLRRDADRQSFARLLLLARRLRCPFRHRTYWLLAAGNTNCHTHNRYR